MIDFLRYLVARIVAPPLCTYCKVFLTEYAVFCSSCTSLIKPIVSYRLPITATKSSLVFAISDYKNPVRTLIVAKGAQNVASARHIGFLLWHLTDLKHHSFDYIIPVPLHWWRYAQRGYNQAAEIAAAFSLQSGVPVLHALRRIRATQRQSKLTHDARLDNVKEAFVLSDTYKKKCRGARILLIDDVMTTGSTLQECARQLLYENPAAITIGVASRVV